MIEIAFADASPASTDCLVFPVPKDAMASVPLPGIAEQEATLVRAAARAQRFEGDAGGIAETFLASGEVTRRVLVAGIGAGKEDEFERAGAAVVARLLASGETAATLALSGLAIAPSAAAAARLALAMKLRSWRYDTYRTRMPEKQKATLARMTIAGAPEGTAAAWAHQSAVADGVAFARELVTEPANIIYPKSFVERCRRLESLGIVIDVLGQAEMEAAGMGALLGVAQGSSREPQLLVMRWDGTGGRQASPVAFVGKGVTFDTGGISLKPPAGMEDMKWDMGGAGAVAGAMLAIASRKAPVHVVGVCGLVENMPDANAQRPGDVVTSMSGQTVEVINTDAEGRLVLCDALTWVQRTYKPRTIVDLATLTGAMIISLGHEHGGLFANDDGLADALLASGRDVGDPLWRFPLGAAYDKLIDSPIADMKNVGPREAGSITAAQFLKRFIDDGVRWAHLDIAGMVWASKAGGTWEKGATGFGVRLLDRFASDSFVLTD